LNVTALKSKSHWFNRLALKLKQLAVEVGQSPLALFRALEERGKVGVIGDKLSSKSLNIARGKVVLRWPARGGWHN
jgi:hypothetical protein